MKKKALLFSVLFVLICTQAFCEEKTDFLGPMTAKMKRGVINTFTGWAEFPIQIWKGYDEGFRGNRKDKFRGILFGIVDGVSHSVGRTASGLSDMLGYWAAEPESDAGVGVSLDGEYAWEKGEPYDGFDPDFTQAVIRPSVNKLFRGSGNLIFGFMELPNQITKGIKDKAPDRGVLKGLWFWASREVSGISDLLSAPFPNPHDNVGFKFDEEWPWEAFGEE